MTATSGLTSGNQVMIYVGYAGGMYASGLYMYAWGGQLETGSFATSYIPTTTASVTRSADNLTIPIGAWYNTSTGTVFTNTAWQSSSGSNFPLLWSFRNAATTNQWNFFYRMSNSTLGIDAYLASVAQGSYSSSTQPLAGSIKIAAAQALDNSNVAFGTTLMTPDSSWTPPAFDTLSFNPVKATEWLSTFKYYPARVTDSQLQLLTQ